MSLQPGSPPSENPFSTRHVRPGAIPFIFPPAINSESLLGLLAEHDWRGSIVGPHGTGKSALLMTLIPAIQGSGRAVVHYELHDGQRRLPQVPALPKGDGNVVVVVDGYEQLSWCRRTRLLRRCQRRHWGLLVTSHAEVNLPTLFRTHVDVALACRLVRDMIGPGNKAISEADVRAAFTRHEGNLRETLFALYDLYESRRAH